MGVFYFKKGDTTIWGRPDFGVWRPGLGVRPPINPGRMGVRWGGLEGVARPGPGPSWPGPPGLVPRAAPGPPCLLGPGAGRGTGRGTGPGRAWGGPGGGRERHAARPLGVPRGACARSSAGAPPLSLVPASPDSLAGASLPATWPPRPPGGLRESVLGQGPESLRLVLLFRAGVQPETNKKTRPGQ